MPQMVTLRAPEPVLGSETLAVTSTNSGAALTAATYVVYNANAGTKAARLATISVDLAAVRVQFNPAVAPVSGGPGHLLQPGDILELTSGSQIVNVRFVKEGSTNAALNCTYWGS